MPLAEPVPLEKYPELLPSPLREGYEFTPVSPLKKSTKMSGRTQTRRLYFSVPTVVAVRWLFSAGEAVLFEAWYEEELAAGSKWFEVELLVPGGFGLFKAKFVDIYKGGVLVGVGEWSFTAELELWERPVLRGGWSREAPEMVAGAAYVDLALNSKWPKA